MFRIRHGKTRLLLSRAVTVFAATTAAVVTTALLAPAAAQAAGAPWAVTAMSGSTPIAKAYGDFAKNGPFATVGMNWVDMSNNGNPVYVEVYWSYWIQDASGSWYWASGGGKQQSARSSRMKYVSGNLSDRYYPEGNRARAEIKVCEDRSKAWDKCSSTATVYFNY
ncbi:hypothetical protein [Fodinicola feengrottensis]|uniref:Secreted protein n=1 Tax=Fodinicola feengrottensis TaxID=435914 RepID=A0ABN2G8N5_9ACTN|nr:hypothetical protein [Fodinicola feengrottensis]